MQLAVYVPPEVVPSRLPRLRSAGSWRADVLLEEVSGSWLSVLN